MRDKSEWWKGIPFGCGQCLPCRINKRRIWSLRMALEFMSAGKGLFITLTYADDNLPLSLSGHGTLCKRDVQLFMKRFRKALDGKEVRYFFCGEYGEQTHRPHYHAILFGVDLEDAQKVADSWPYGLVHCGECNKDTIQYVAGYCLKKIVRKDDNPLGLNPEFTLTSRKPGLGSLAIPNLVHALSLPGAKEAFNIGDFDNDIPGSLKVFGRNLPLGRYMITKLRDAVGICTDKENGDYLEEMKEKYLLSLRDSSLYDYAIDNKTDSILAALLMREDEQKARNLETRTKIFNKRNKI